MSDFQDSIRDWMKECFGEKCLTDKVERNWRFLEEAVELVQSLGATKEEVLDIVDYVYSRAPGKPAQECGGVLVTLAGICIANSFDMEKVGEDERKRVWSKIPEIRARHVSKPNFSRHSRYYCPSCGCTSEIRPGCHCVCHD